MQSATTTGERQTIANTFIDADAAQNQFIRSPEQLVCGTAVQSAVASTSSSNQPTATLFLTTVVAQAKKASLADLANDQGFQQDRARLSNSLLARLYTTHVVPNLELLQKLYRAYHLVQQRAAGATIDMAWDRLLRLLIVIPEGSLPSLAGAPRTQPPNAETTTGAQPEDPGADELARLSCAYRELIRLDTTDTIVQPESAQVNEHQTNIFALTSTAIGRLSAETRHVLAERALAPETTPIHAIVMALYTALQQEHAYATPTVSRKTTAAGSSRKSESGASTSAHRDVRPSGIGNLLVVKQQIKRYEPGEIAHIENILAGETKSRELRELQQIEETFSNGFETTREEQNELETAQRFELNQETSRTIQQDQKVNFGVNLSGKYGPYVEFSSNVALETSQSVEETNSNSTNYAQDIVERSLERIVERIREERTRRILREIEQKNLHALTNTSVQHIRGVYQFVDKVYEGQVFDYGIRMMYDFMIPEPASYLHYLRGQPESKLELSEPPSRFTLTSHKQIDEFTYGTYVSTYGATDIDPPPDPYILASANLSNQDDDEGGAPRFAKTEKLTIPKGYGPERVEYAAQATADEDMAITVLIGSRFHHMTRSEDNSWPSFPQRMSLDQSYYGYPEGAQLAVGVFVCESRSFIVDITVFCKRRPEAYEQWQLRTFQKIQQAYERRVTEYEEKVASIKAEAALAQAEVDQETDLGAPPSINRVTERNELKKHTIAIVTGSRYEDIDAMVDDDPPYFNFAKAREEGSLIRFFEQAFEWDQMQYVFYPYFWGRTSTWQHRFVTDDPDPQFREFLKAGAARVVVSVRPGFETALQHYLDTGKLWDGQGDPPQIASPLYVSIVDEIRERTGASQGETLIGEPWDIRLPTNLLYVRADDELPQWVQNPPGSWQWEPVPEGAESRQAVIALVLVDADTRKEIQQLNDGAVITLENLPARVTIRALTRPEHVGSVSFNLNNGQHTQVESYMPYLLYGGTESQYTGVAPKAGDYTLCVTAYTGPKGLGAASQVRTVRYSFKKKTAG
jgi:hypothetical protein